MENNLKPQIGMEFDSIEEAWEFWAEYARRTGFGPRKYNVTKSKKDGAVTSCRYVYCKEGVRRQPKGNFEPIKHRFETRTNCKAKIDLRRTCTKYRIHLFVEEHNYLLHLPETVHMLPSQRKISKVQAYEIEMEEEAGLQPMATFELMSRHAGGRSNLGYIKVDVRNYLNSKRQRNMAFGEVTCLFEYFKRQWKENPSFYHAYQTDMEEQITNVFWADARMLVDYAFFGDVLSLDTTYRTNRNHRPLAIFSGLNHYKGTIIFGVALMYDETIDSFKWLFETFLDAHNDKRLETIFADQYQAMARALQEVLPDTKHGLCTWHLMENGMKHLGNLMKKKGSHFLADFKKCMFEYHEEWKFEEEWDKMLSTYNMHENTWLKSVYNIKEK